MIQWRGDMADVAELCGEDVAIELHRKLPGVILYVPAKIRDGNPIKRLSQTTQQNLQSYFSGNTIVISSSRRTAKETLSIIESLLDQGHSSARIALKLGITQNYIFKLRKKASLPRIASRPVPKQLTLFKFPVD